MKYKTDINSPELKWREGTTPYSEAYSDVYFMPDEGLNEARHVFLDGNNLAERWQLLVAGDVFTIFECGFGTGLNCLAAIALWQSLKPDGHLNYVAFEGYPLHPDDLNRALSVYQPDIDCLDRFQESYRDLLATGRAQFSENTHIELRLCNVESLHKSPVSAPLFDAIFMDGFSPSANPEMWSPELCEYLFNHSNCTATLATFSVAGMVKRNLRHAGFMIQKKKGYGKKREMLTAYKAAS